MYGSHLLHHTLYLPGYCYYMLVYNSRWSHTQVFCTTVGTLSPSSMNTDLLTLLKISSYLSLVTCVLCRTILPTTTVVEL